MFRTSHPYLHASSTQHTCWCCTSHFGCRHPTKTTPQVLPRHANVFRTKPTFRVRLSPVYQPLLSQDSSYSDEILTTESRSLSPFNAQSQVRLLQNQLEGAVACRIIYRLS